MSQVIGLYLHIPFCRRKCAYCDFNSYAGLEEQLPAYCSALIREMELWADQGLVASTLYVGGGTPSLLSGDHVDLLLEAAGRHLALAPGAEVSIEANPGTVDRAWLGGARRLGVSRVSLGVQSFHDSELRMLGRIHDADAARESFSLARQVGCDNINLDLIYGLPGQEVLSWRTSLEEALRLCPEHLSLYCLTVEEGTPMARWLESGERPHPDPDVAADMYLLAEELLEHAGYVHYEISNWALPGRECQHNLIYWRNQPYLGLGAGAHSSLRLALRLPKEQRACRSPQSGQGGVWGGYRFHNVETPQDYVRRGAELRPVSGDLLQVIGSRSAVAGAELIGRELEIAETMVLGLRVTSGVSLEGFRRRFGVGLVVAYGPQVKELTELGLVEVQDGHLRLTSRGRLLGNEAFWRFLPQ